MFKENYSFYLKRKPTFPCRVPSERHAGITWTSPGGRCLTLQAAEEYLGRTGIPRGLSRPKRGGRRSLEAIPTTFVTTDDTSGLPLASCGHVLSPPGARRTQTEADKCRLDYPNTQFLFSQYKLFSTLQLCSQMFTLSPVTENTNK